VFSPLQICIASTLNTSLLSICNTLENLSYFRKCNLVHSRSKVNNTTHLQYLADDAYPVSYRLVKPFESHKTLTRLQKQARFIVSISQSLTNLLTSN